jgi:hypothetical protein
MHLVNIRYSRRRTLRLDPALADATAARVFGSTSGFDPKA